MNINVNRRNLLASTGALIVSVGLPGVAQPALAAMPAALAKRPALDPTKLASYISVNADGTINAYLGKLDMGQGTDIGIAQMVAEELDVPVEKVHVLQGDTDLSLNMGGATGSSGIWKGGDALRNAAAEAHRVLVEMASEKLGIPAAQLTTENGIVKGGGKSVTYAELIGGKWFDVPMEWNKQIGIFLGAKGEAKPKSYKDYKVVGKTYPRRDVADKVLGKMTYAVDVKPEGMQHARLMLPPVVGANVVSIDENTIKAIPGARVVRHENFVAVVAPREWDAIKAQRALKITWSDAQPNLPGNAGVYDWIRKAKANTRKVEVDIGDLDKAFAGAAKVVEATYEWPFQSHASMGPGCAVVDYKPDGITTVWTPTQKPHYARDGVANILGISPDKVHGIYMMGPGSYGRNDSGDAAMAAALISKEIGKPVRMQHMRDEGHGWDPKNPASVHTVRAAVDKDGNVIAYHFESKGFSRLDVESNESQPAHTLPGQLSGVPLKYTAAFGVPEESYGFATRRKAWETVPPLVDRGSPLRTSHMRDPIGPQVHFASESFMDELAYAINMDPVAFRMKYLTDARDQAVIKAAAEKAGWTPRTAARKQMKGDVATGQGIAFSQRSGTRVAVISEVEVNAKTGKIWCKRFTVAHDCGQIINPGLLRMTIEGNIVQGASRAVWEETHFDDKHVTSIDWVSYPIIDMTEAPETVEIVLIDHPEIAPTGAGEPSMRPIAAAIANAIFDATGVRMRQAPFTPERVKAGFA
jgi:nicotinate dehydrogenase subunit B